MRLRTRLALTGLAAAIPTLASMVFIQRQMRERVVAELIVERVRAEMESGGRATCEAAPADWGDTGRPIFRGGPRWRHRPALGSLGGPTGMMRMHAATATSGDPAERHRTEVGASLTAECPPGERCLTPVLSGPGIGQLSIELYAYGPALRSMDDHAPTLDEPLVRAINDGADTATHHRERGSEEGQDILVRMSWADGPCAFVLARTWSPRAPMVDLTRPHLGWVLPLVTVLGAVLLSMGPVVRRIRRLEKDVLASARTGYSGAIATGGSDEITALAEAFERAAAEVRSQIASQAEREATLRRFLENTTHDVMIPLTVLQGHLATLRKSGTTEPLDPAVIGQAIDEAHYMGALIHNLAVAAKLEAHGELQTPELARAPVDLTELVERATSRHRPIARERQVEFQHAVPEERLETVGDVTLLEQAVSNLVYNAVRHNNPGGHVAVILETPEPGRFRLRVVDDGPGIPDAERSRLVERGYRTDRARTREPAGQGLGLHIAHAVAAVHGLELRLARSEYGGLEVTLSGPSTVRAP